VYKIFDWLFSAMQMSALNWLKIGRRAADAGLDVAQSAKTHAKELARRIDEKKNNPVRQRLAEWRNKIASWGQDFDDELLRLNKALVSGAAVLFIPAGLLWSAAYFWLGLREAGFAPLTGTLLLAIGLVYYTHTKNYCRVKSDFSFLASRPLSRATLRGESRATADLVQKVT
jgi:hypothetical protein